MARRCRLKARRCRRNHDAAGGRHDAAGGTTTLPAEGTTLPTEARRSWRNARPRRRKPRPSRRTNPAAGRRHHAAGGARRVAAGNAAQRADARRSSRLVRTGRWNGECRGRNVSTYRRAVAADADTIGAVAGGRTPLGVHLTSRRSRPGAPCGQSLPGSGSAAPASLFSILYLYKAPPDSLKSRNFWKPAPYSGKFGGTGDGRREAGGAGLGADVENRSAGRAVA